MKPVILLLAATALIGAAPPRPAPRFEAGGFEPSWELVIQGARLTYNPGTSDRTFTIPVPRRRPVRNGYRLVSPRLMVEVLHTRCQSYGGRHFTDTVNVTYRGRFQDGCGGGVLPPPDLGYSAWDIQAVGGTRVRSEHNPNIIEFREGRITLRTACHDYGGTYRERRPILTVGALTTTRTACPTQAIERRALAILRGPLRMTWVEGDTLVLTGPGGAIRLFPS